ncbi:MAG: F0F1 ATP synthase subunit delta [Alphaproteobacteria bacterium]
MATQNSMSSGVAGRYAAALFELAKNAGKLDAVYGDLASFKSLIGESDDLAKLVNSPLFSREDQQAGIGTVMEKGGADELTRSFIGVVTQNRRLFALPDMIDAFRAMLADHRGETTAEVVSARPLSPEQADALRETLTRELRSDVQIESSVDDTLLGGLIVRVGSRMIDNSLRTKLSNLQLAMKGVG